MERREFLKKAGKILTLSAFTPQVIFSMENTRGIIFELTKEEIDYKINKSRKKVGEIEFNHFVNFFSLDGGDLYEIYNKILEIQKNNGLLQDGILGPKTLEIIYKNYYSRNIEKCSKDIRIRWNIYKEMIKYPKYPRKGDNKYGIIYSSSIPKVFDKNYYYGYVNTQNIKGTYIDKSLLALIDLYGIDKYNINQKGNIAFLKKVNGKFVVLVYINGELELASYVSPGNSFLDGGVKTKKGKFISKRSDKYHISSADASVRIIKGRAYGAVMPYAVHVTGGIYAHAGKVNGSRLSYGCIRLPLYYAKGLYKIFNKYGNINWHILDN